MYPVPQTNMLSMFRRLSGHETHPVRAQTPIIHTPLRAGHRRLRRAVARQHADRQRRARRGAGAAAWGAKGDSPQQKPPQIGLITIFTHNTVISYIFVYRK